MCSRDRRRNAEHGTVTSADWLRWAIERDGWETEAQIELHINTALTAGFCET